MWYVFVVLASEILGKGRHLRTRSMVQAFMDERLDRKSDKEQR